ncbi:hypothetical protein BC833DRAFT_605793 [Globomyces pollinis-pini]|nr:hypothetical protein BC833DRAFT_605793 [Globomyces pollinis-pini]
MLWKLFERLKVIQTLKFNICTNDPKLMYNMLQSVQSVMTIKHLVIRGFISKPCYPLLAKMIKNNPVVSLGIQTNSDIVKFLMLVLKKLTTLRVLNLHFILHSCCSTIVEFIEQNKFISKFTYNRQSVLRQSEYFSLLKAIESNSTLKEVVIPFGLTFNVEAERTLIDSISLRNPLLKIPSKGVVPTNGCQNQMLEDARRMYLTRHHLFMLNSFVSYDILMIMFEYLSITRPSDFLVMVKVLMNRELLGELPKLKQMEFDAHEIVRCCYAFQLLQHST